MLLETLKIENFLHIESLELHFDDVGVLFGDHGCDVLQAAALLLMGSGALGELFVSPDKWIREGYDQARISGRVSAGENRGYCASLDLWKGQTMLQVMSSNDTTIDYADRRHFGLFGYGKHRRPDTHIRFPQWYRHPESEAVATLFSSEPTMKKSEDMMLDWRDDLIYRSGLDQYFPSGICGILLLDEIELHLKPQDQQSVVERIRRYFPHLQVIATSQSPIVAGTLRRSEALSTEGAEGGSPFGLSVDQVLAGHLFQMESTRAPEFNRELADVRKRVNTGDIDAADQLSRMLAFGEDWDK